MKLVIVNPSVPLSIYKELYNEEIKEVISIITSTVLTRQLVYSVYGVCLQSICNKRKALNEKLPYAM